MGSLIWDDDRDGLIAGVWGFVLWCLVAFNRSSEEVSSHDDDDDDEGMKQP